MVEDVKSAVVRVARYASTQGRAFVELLQFIVHKKCVVNVKNADNTWFGYNLLASRLISHDTPNRPDDYETHLRAKNLHRIHKSLEPNQVPALGDTL